MKRQADSPTTLIDRRDTLGMLAGLMAAATAPAALSAPRSTALGWPGPDLSRGINLSHWFAQSQNGYGPDHLARFVTRADIAGIAAAGFSHVRLGFEPDVLFGPSGAATLNEAVAQPLLEAVTMINALNLGVVLDMHPVGASKDKYQSAQGADRLIANWRLLAQRLAPIPRDRLALEILNEPEPLSGDSWWALQERIVNAIGQVDPARPLIVNAGGWSGADELVKRKPYRHDGLIYTIHHYMPLLFTHQGTSWTWPVAERVNGLSWPIAPEQAEPATNAALTSDQDRPALRNQIASSQFTEDAMLTPFKQLAAWSQHHGQLPIYVGEFGVYLKRVPREAGLRWLAASRRAFAGYGWGWALWDNTPDFGFLSPGTKQIDPATLQALGMTPT